MDLNRSEISAAFGVSMPTIDEWRKKGCPCHQSGKKWVFTVHKVSDWLRARDIESSGTLDLGQERAKLTKLQAEKTTIELEQTRGNLIPFELVVETWQGHIANARAKLLGLPPKAAAQIEGAESYAEIEGILKDIVNEALDELATDGLPKEYSRSIETIAANLESAADADG